MVGNSTVDLSPMTRMPGISRDYDAQNGKRRYSLNQAWQNKPVHAERRGARPLQRHVVLRGPVNGGVELNRGCCHGATR